MLTSRATAVAQWKEQPVFVPLFEDPQQPPIHSEAQDNTQTPQEKHIKIDINIDQPKVRKIVKNTFEL